jgi:hypothetical protein
MLHAALGGLCSLALLLLVLSWWLVQSTRNTIRGSVPLGGFITSLLMLLFAFWPEMRGALLGTIRPSSTSDIMTWLSARDPFWNLPVGWIGAALFVVLVVWSTSVGARMSMRIFASAPDPEGPVEFTIGSDGRRIDILPPTPLAQRCLGWLIWQVGIIILLESTYVDSVSFALAILVLSKDACLYQLSRGVQFAWRYELKPEVLRPLVSMATYEQEGKHRTEVAISLLRGYLQTHSAEMSRCFHSQDTELRLRRFADGCGHFSDPGGVEDLSEIMHRRSWCSVL